MKAGFARHEPTISTNEVGRYRIEARITGNVYSLEKTLVCRLQKRKEKFLIYTPHFSFYKIITNKIGFCLFLFFVFVKGIEIFIIIIVN